MLKLLMVGLGGCVGALARYGLGGLVQRHLGSSFPSGTLVVNLAGCFMIGGLMCLVEERQFFAPETRLFVQIGFLGSLTTLSTVGYETFESMKAGDIKMAMANAVPTLFSA